MDVRETAVVGVIAELLDKSSGRIAFSRLGSIIDSTSLAVRRSRPIALVVGGLGLRTEGVADDLKFATKESRHRALFALRLPEVLSFVATRFSSDKTRCAGVVITRGAFSERTQYFAIRDTVSALLSNGVVPVVFNNDLVELEGSGEGVTSPQLVGLLAGMLNAPLAVLLSEKRGVVIRSRGRSESHELREVLFADLDRDLESKAVRLVHPQLEVWRGIRPAARLLHDLGIPLLIASGSKEDPVGRVLDGVPPEGTLLKPGAERAFTGVRRWLCTGAIPRGTLIVSPIGADSIKRSKGRGSLLAAGLLDIDGQFEADDVVSICDQRGVLLGYGVSRYSARDLANLKGRDEVIVVHADYLYSTSAGLT